MRLNSLMSFLLALVVIAPALGYDYGKGGNGKGGKGKGPDPITNGFRDCRNAKLACRILRNGVEVLKRRCLVSTATCTRTGGTAVGPDGMTYTFIFCSEVANAIGDGFPDQCLRNPPVLPPASDNPVILVFCDPRWYNLACLVTSATGATLKTNTCPRNGVCAFPGSYTYNGENVTANFCVNCQQVK